jgi:hypothetical protein
VKLLAIAILEALAEITGGDTPLALFMGDVQAVGEIKQRLEKYLPNTTPSLQSEQNSVVYHLLAQGRSGQSLFDIQNAPLALYQYVTLGSKECNVLLGLAKELMTGERKPTDFLSTIDSHVLSTIAQACAHMVPTRRDLLNNIVTTSSKH